MDGDPMDTVAEETRRLQAEGYTGNLYATAEHTLRCDEWEEEIDPAETTVEHVLRFEGQSDPGDMVIMFALRTPSGHGGVYSAAYGANTSTEDAAVIARLHRATGGTSTHD